MATYLEIREISDVVTRLLDNLSLVITARTDSASIDLRRQIGVVRAKHLVMLADGTFPDELLACFTLALDAVTDVVGLDHVLTHLFEEEPTTDMAVAIVNSAILFCMSAQSRVIVKMEFTSRDDVDAMIGKMTGFFDTAKEIAADSMGTACYQNLNSLAGSLTNHLATTARPLPRIIEFMLPVPMPALAASMRLYYTADRWEELVDENKVIHPLFVPRMLRGMSA